MEETFVCKICGRSFKNAYAMNNHLKFKHKMSSKEYYDKFYKTEKEGKCLICGFDTQFNGIKLGYNKYCCRKCSFSSDEFILKIKEGMKDSDTWNTFKNSDKLKKEKNERCKKSEYLTKTVHTKEYKERLSRAMKTSKKWKDAHTTKEYRELCSRNFSKLAAEGKLRVIYKYDEKTFSSSYELAYYIWLKDSKKDFIYQADPIPYEFDGVIKHYVPDFKVDDQLIEIKGIHFFENKDPNGKMICPWKKKNDTEETIKQRNELFEAKHQCMIRHNVIIITDCSLYIEYVKTHYGEDYLTQFRV